ncbi:transposable element Tc1 transposase [Trichonephila clavipes]|nr:transposable element Tc1 transposase [Trichonephila clavipes]
MPRRRIRAHYEQLSEFERGCIIELIEGGRANCRIARHMSRSWNHVDWGRTVFSDESCFQLCPDDHRRRVWRRPGQRADPAFTVARHTGLQQEVMVWGAISFEAGPLWSSLETRLQHIGTLSNTSLASQIVRSLSNRACLGYDGKATASVRNVLTRQLENIWQGIPQETIRVLYHSMSCRVAACIQARGGSSPY